MTHHLHQRKLQGRRVLANYGAVFIDDLISADILKTMPVELNNCVFAASEVHLFLETRRTQRNDQIMITYAISQFRKRRIEFHWDSQNIEKVERRLIDETDYLVHCENLGCGEIDCLNQACGIETCGIFHYEVWDKHNARLCGDYYLNGPKDFYHLFDSEEVVMDFTTDGTED